jgi:hypothetical protein
MPITRFPALSFAAEDARDAFSTGSITRIVRPEAGAWGFPLQNSEGVDQEKVWQPHGSLIAIAYAALSEPSQILSSAEVRPMILRVLGRCKHRYTQAARHTTSHSALFFPIVGLEKPCIPTSRPGSKLATVPLALCC